MPRAVDRPNRHGTARRLRRLRDVLGLTQRELAREFKVTHGAIAGWESGKRAPPGPVLKLLELYEEEIGLGAPDTGLTRIPTSMAGRDLALAAAAASAFTRLGLAHMAGVLLDAPRASGIAQRTQVAIARHLAETLGDLKGVAMKLGQLFSYADLALDGPLKTELRALLATSRPMSPALVTRVVLQELGAPPRQLFAEWSTQPFAAASIGQVHRARLRSGELVAVKVQYPTIAEAIQADLRSAALVDRLSSLLFRGQQPGVLLAEIGERFCEECDYRVEADNQEVFRQKWLERPGVVIPRVFRELSTRRILVTELARGQGFDTFRAQASQLERDRAGMLLSQFAFESIFDHGLFNADPHPGNYLFDADSVVFLDFGCVKRFPREVIARWKALMRATLEGDAERSAQAWVAMGMVPDPSRYDFSYHQRMMLTLYEPWLADGHYHFTPAFVERTWRALMLENPNQAHTNIPKDLVFVSRLQWGLYAVLAELGATGDFRRAILDLLYAPGEPRPAPLAALSAAAGTDTTSPAA